ncbi:MAG TPA: phosphopantetheine-binding protein [Streptosporangiaceae bacterium]|nr:phosphopantetheine-binding protein [Streptosporangiaceae bacterium]
MSEEAQARETASEERLSVICSLWAEVLGLDTVPYDTNFFEVGGDSLLLVALVERIRQSTGLAVRTIDVVRAGTVRRQVDLLAGLGAKM